MAQEPPQETESAQFARSLRGRSGRLGPVSIGAAALCVIGAGVWAMFASSRASDPQRAGRELPTAASETQEEAPSWLNEEPHRDEEGGAGKAKSRNRFGIEGPADDRAPHMSREAAREAAANAGIVGVLKQAPAPMDTALGNDPMSGLGALMGDQIGATFGFVPTGLRSTGRRDREGLVGAERSGTIGHAATTPDGAEGTLDAGKRAASRPPPLAAAVSARSARQQARADRPAEGAPASTRAEDGPQFIDANGYFANTYVPGDPELRTLYARLRDYDRTSLLPEPLRAAQLEAAVRRVAQPFDAPEQSALSVFVSASERGITSARRMLLQVGLQATRRYGGRRPAMNVAIVLDARAPLDPTAHANVRALLAAFADTRDPSDKLTLYAAGPGGGALVAASDFRHGPLSVALQRLQSERGATQVSLPDALQAALQSLHAGDDPNAPLGSSAAIVIAPHALDGELERLETLARDSAGEGVLVSAFGVGPAVAPDHLTRIALAGQGNRRLLERPADAAQAVDRELSAVARVVARAVRLRIRLASGVELVSVLGSHPLDEQRAEQVREAENTLDRRLRQNLGIAQDRGEDEAGIQIVIPSFYAGDSHVVLLDVVAGGPGAIADVSVRYKDLVQLQNGSVRESLWLPNLELARTALQRNVLKNRAAHELASHMRRAGDALATYPDSSSAERELNGALALLQSLTNELPELHGDRELEADRTLATEYLALLAHVQEPARRQLATDSLRLASLFKLQPRPE